MVHKLKEKGTQYEIDYVGREDKRRSDHMMYMNICAEIQDEFLKFSGKFKSDFNVEMEESEVAKTSKILTKKLPKDMSRAEKGFDSIQDDLYMNNIQKHDSSTKSLFQGYFKVIQRFYEDFFYHKKDDVVMLYEFQEFERSHHSQDAGFLQIWEIMNTIFEKVDYDTVKSYEDDEIGLKKLLTTNTCRWLENEFCKELGIDGIIEHHLSELDDDQLPQNYVLPDEAIKVIIECICNYLKDNDFYNTSLILNGQNNDSKLSNIGTNQDGIPIYAVIYFMIRCGRRKEALIVAQECELSIAKVLQEWFDDDKFDYQFDNSIELFESKDNDQLGYNKDIFKEALIILVTKYSGNPDSNLCNNLADYLWFNLQKCHFRKNKNDRLRYDEDTLTLEILQNSIIQHGEEYFNENGANPLNFYKVLILVGLYEEAVLYMNSIDKYNIQNAHVAIILDGIGILSYTKTTKYMKQNKGKLGMKKNKEDLAPTFPKIIKSFIEFLGSQYFTESIIYASLLIDEYQVKMMSHLFFKNNSFNLLLGETDKDKINLVTKKDVPLSKFVNQNNLTKIIEKVTKKVYNSTVDPKICILLQDKIQNDKVVVDLLINEQNRVIEYCRSLNEESKLISSGLSVYNKSSDYNYLMRDSNKASANIASTSQKVIDADYLVSKEYDFIIKKIKAKASNGSIDHKEYMERLENIDSVAKFINLFRNKKYSDAYDMM